MPDQTNPDDSRRQRLNEVIGAFLVALDDGQNPIPREWLARHSELCPELAEFFADRERMDDLVEPLRMSPDLTTAADFSDSEATNDNGASAPLPKATLVRYFGDYELQKVLGEGGMGIVYKARQLSLNRPVALKMIKAARFASADEVSPVSERGRGRRPARPSQHCADLRGRPVRRPALLQHEADRGREPRQAAEGLRRRPAARGASWWPWRPARSTTPTSEASSTAT